MLPIEYILSMASLHIQMIHISYVVFSHTKTSNYLLFNYLIGCVVRSAAVQRHCWVHRSGREAAAVARGRCAGV